MPPRQDTDEEEAVPMEENVEEVQETTQQPTGEDAAPSGDPTEVEEAHDENEPAENEDNQNEQNQASHSENSESEDVEEVPESGSGSDGEPDFTNIRIAKKKGQKVESAPKRGKRRTPRRLQTAETDEAPAPEPEPEPLEESGDSEDEETKRRNELEERIDAALRTNKRKKMTGDDIEAMQDDMIAKLRKEMRDAAYADAEAIKNREPALNKIKMLPEVAAVLNKHSLVDSILDGNLLESVRIWLEPLPDASLPSYEIQKELFSALEKLPIKTMHLRDSGLGRIVLFYQKSKRPHGQVKRSAEKLISDWMRPLMGRSDDYRSRNVVTASYDPRDRHSLKRSAPQARSLAETMAERRGRAAIPTARGDTYQIAPMDLTTETVAAQSARGNGDQQLKRIKTRLANATKSQKSRSKVSIEGRNLH